MTKVALLNPAKDLAVARRIILMAKGRLENVERALTTQKLTNHEAYLDKFARADELRRLVGEAERFVNRSESEI